MIFEGFGLMILNWLRIPPGTSLRKTDGSKTGTGFDVSTSDLVNSIVEITADDVCLGSSPLYYSCTEEIPKHLRKKVDLMVVEFNSIVRWVAIDLLKKGYSVYTSEVSTEKNLLLFPILGEFEFYLDKQKKIHVFKAGEKEAIAKAIVFINYDKDSLQEIEDKEYEKFKFKVNPCPIQLKNISTIAADLDETERAIQRYRKQVSKLVRILTVDIGIAQGAAQTEITDSISSAVNADSSSLSPSGSARDFDDSIPVIPNRRGAGKPELIESTPSFEISKVVDLDYNLSKLYLALRFPKSYADFSDALDQTAVSTIRGDIRYNRLLSATRTKIEDTINMYFASSRQLKPYGNIVSLSELPTPEDEDVIAAMDTFTEFSDKVFEHILGNAKTRQEAVLKLELLKTLLGGVATFKYLQKWFTLFEEFIEKHFDGEAPVDTDGSDGSDVDLSEGAEFADDLDAPIENEVEPTDFPDEVENVEEQTEG